MAIGSIVGGVLGAALGGGNPLGYALGSGVGGALEGGMLWNKANKTQISETDPRTRLLYDEIVRKRKGLESGQLYQPQQDAIRQAGAQTMQTAAGVTGGDIGATVSALRGINRSTGRNLNELYGQMMGQSTNLLGQQTAVDQMLYNWNYQKQAYEKQQAMAHAAQTLKDSMANTNAVIASRGDELSNNLRSLFAGNRDELQAIEGAGSAAGSQFRSMFFNPQAQQLSPQQQIPVATGNKYADVGRVLYENMNKPFVQRILMGNNQPVFGSDQQGNPMTHLMTSIDNLAVPSLQYDDKTKQWKDLRSLPLNQVVDESMRSNNFIEFQTPEEANWFGKNYHFIMDQPELIDRVRQNKGYYSKYL